MSWVLQCLCWRRDAYLGLKIAKVKQLIKMAAMTGSRYELL
jgi:hypothetical protein